MPRWEKPPLPSQLSDPREIVRSLYSTYPGERNLTFADETTAKWVSVDCIRVVLKTRRDWLDSWFNATLEPILICRHSNWKLACGSCKETVKNGVDKQLEKMAAEQYKQRRLNEPPKYRIGKEPGRL